MFAVGMLDAEEGFCRLSLAFPSQTALVAGSMGQAGGGGSSAALAIMINYNRRFVEYYQSLVGQYSEDRDGLS